MQTTYDSVIVGGGVIGLFSAHALQARGLNVALIDDGRAGQASAAAGGILSPLYPWQTSAAVANLLQASLQLYQPWLADIKTSQAQACSQPGLLYLNCQDQEQASMWAQRYGWPLQTHNALDLARLEPQLAKSVTQGGGFSLPSVHCLSPAVLLNSLRARLDKKTDFYQQTALRIVVKNKQLHGVQLAGQVLKTSRVIVCAGAWISQLVPALSSIRPVRGQMMRLATNSQVLKHIVVHGGHYVIPSPDGGLVVGSTVEEVGFDLSTTTTARHELSEAACNLLPQLKNIPVVEHWSGLRPGFIRQEPLIACHPQLDGLFVHGGHFRNGISLAAASAERLAHIICQEPDNDETDYQWPGLAANDRHYNAFGP